MTIETRIMPFERDVLFDLSGLSPEEQSAVLAEFARQEIDAAAAQNKAAIGHSVDYETFIDGAKSNRLESVSPAGTIVAEFDLGTDLVQWVWDEVQKHSPVLTGAFKRSQRLFADGGARRPGEHPGRRRGDRNRFRRALCAQDRTRAIEPSSERRL